MISHPGGFRGQVAEAAVIGGWVGSVLGSAGPLVFGGAERSGPLGFVTGVVLGGLGVWVGRRRGPEVSDDLFLRSAIGWSRGAIAARVSGACVWVGTAGAFGLGMYAACSTGSPGRGAGFFLAAGCALVAGPSLWARHRMERAVEAIVRGELDSGKEQWVRIARSSFGTSASRDAARLWLGRHHLGEGELELAALWLGQVDGGAAASVAASGIARVRLLQGRPEEANRLMRRSGEVRRDIPWMADALEIDGRAVG